MKKRKKKKMDFNKNSKNELMSQNLSGRRSDENGRKENSAIVTERKMNVENVFLLFFFRETQLRCIYRRKKIQIKHKLD